jgi:hypothetical protein
MYIFSDNSSATSTLAQASSGLILHHRQLIQPSIDCLRNQNRQIFLNWVPSHCDIPGNEMADSLAKSAASTPDSPQHPTTPSYLKRILKKTRYKLWQKAFESRTSGAVYYGNPCLKPTTGVAISQERSYIFVQVTVFSHLPDILLPSSVISSAPVNRKKPEITFSYTAHGITEHESNSSKLFNSLQMILRCHRQPPLPEHFYTPSHQKNHYTIAGILELKCLIQIKMVRNQPQSTKTGSEAY